MNMMPAIANQRSDERTTKPPHQVAAKMNANQQLTITKPAANDKGFLEHRIVFCAHIVYDVTHTIKKPAVTHRLFDRNLLV
jgi:hypothetical protein